MVWSAAKSLSSTSVPDTTEEILDEFERNSEVSACNHVRFVVVFCYFEVVGHTLKKYRSVRVEELLVPLKKIRTKQTSAATASAMGVKIHAARPILPIFWRPPQTLQLKIPGSGLRENGCGVVDLVGER